LKVARKGFPLQSAKRATKLAIALHNIVPLIDVLNLFLSFFLEKAFLYVEALTNQRQFSRWYFANSSVDQLGSLPKCLANCFVKFQDISIKYGITEILSSSNNFLFLLLEK